MSSTVEEQKEAPEKSHFQARVVLHPGGIGGSSREEPLSSRSCPSLWKNRRKPQRRANFKQELSSTLEAQKEAPKKSKFQAGVVILKTRKNKEEEFDDRNLSPSLNDKSI
jgi:hypothetical protein